MRSNATAAVIVVASGVASGQQTESAFETRHARYLPASWADVPGWANDDGVSALSAFKRSCRVLTRREIWAEVCGHASSTEMGGSARQFFERHFGAYQVRTFPGNSEKGTLTGYFEPLVLGSKVRDQRFRVPVYGTPGDLLLLDSRQAKDLANAAWVDGRVEGRVLVLRPATSEATAAWRRMRLSLPANPPLPLDRRLRVRLVNGEIVQYPARQVIQSEQGLDAEVLAWVEAPEALYLMQVQGSGRIALSDGTQLRLAYAEQNGHPFAGRPQEVRSKGVGQGLTVGQANPEVEQLVELFERAARGGGTPGPTPRELSAPAPEQSPGKRADARPLTMGNDLIRHADLGAYTDGAANDASFVFFRLDDPKAEGPTGAMGMTLTPDSSIAVDPRVTPLGAPVFLAASSERTGGEMRRLVVAQDTGGAIRGAVRADYFFGRGRAAAQRAMSTRQDLRLWVLLPHKVVASLKAAAESRSKGIVSTAEDIRECLVADDTYCPE